MSVIDTPISQKVIDFHVRYKLHVFHPKTNGHAGTLQLDIKWTGPALNSPPEKGEDFKCTWKWSGSPYGTVGGVFFITGPALTSRLSLRLNRPDSGLVRETMFLINDRWPGPGPVSARPEHPWFKLLDKVGLKDPNFVSTPQRPQTLMGPEDPVVQQWICKPLTGAKTSIENTIP